MGVTVYVPFAVSVIVAVLSRLASSRLWPRAAVPAIVATALALAVSNVGALVLLACPLPAQLPLVASLGRWRPAAVGAHSPTPAVVSLVAMAALVALAWRTVHELRDLASELRSSARLRRTISGRASGGVVVINDGVPAAHAIGGVATRQGAVVITSSMVELLDAEEREAVIAHERAHLRQHHTILMAIVRLSATVNPVLGGMVHDMRFALERWADEDAAEITERSVVASALAKVALGVLGSVRAAPLANMPALHHHGVTDRVAALLDEPNHRSRPAWAFIALSLVAAAGLAWATHSTERFFEAARVWSHQ